MTTDIEKLLDTIAEQYSNDASGVEKLMAADAIDKGHLVIFNSWDNQVQAAGWQLTETPQKFDLGTITFMAFDHVHGKWFIYRNKQLPDIWSRSVADHFTDNKFREYHKIV